MQKAVALLCFIFVSYVCEAKFEGTYGPEFTVTSNYGDVRTGEDLALNKKLIEHLIENQPEGAKFRQNIKLGYPPLDRYESPNGWWFAFRTDPGVIEIQMKPMTVKDFKKYQSDMQDAIFVSAANVGLFPWDYQGGGHINIGVGAFDGNPLLLRNFIVDYFNHNELALGVLNYDTLNAASLSIQNSNSIEAVQELLNRFDQNEFGNNYSGVRRFLGDLNFFRSRSSDFFAHHGRGKNTDMSFDAAASGDERIEIRAVRPQKSIDRWVKQIELLDARINYLAKIKTPIPLKFKVNVKPFPTNPTHEELQYRRFNPPVDPQEALRAFYEYVNESGLKWSDYVSDLWPKWIADGEVKKFEASKWFKRREAKNCSQLLGQ